MATPAQEEFQRSGTGDARARARVLTMPSHLGEGARRRSCVGRLQLRRQRHGRRLATLRGCQTAMKCATLFHTRV